MAFIIPDCARKHGFARVMAHHPEHPKVVIPRVKFYDILGQRTYFLEEDPQHRRVPIAEILAAEADFLTKNPPKQDLPNKTPAKILSNEELEAGINCAHGIPCCQRDCYKPTSPCFKEESRRMAAAVASTRPAVPDQTMFLREDEEPREGGLFVLDQSHVMVYAHDLQPVELHEYFSGAPPTIMRAHEITLLDYVHIGNAKGGPLPVKRVFSPGKQATEKEKSTIAHPWDPHMPLFVEEDKTPKNGQLQYLYFSSEENSKTLMAWEEVGQQWVPVYDYYNTVLSKAAIQSALEKHRRAQQDTEECTLEAKETSPRSIHPSERHQSPSTPRRAPEPKCEGFSPLEDPPTHIERPDYGAIFLEIEKRLFAARRETKQQMEEVNERSVSEDIASLLFTIIERRTEEVFHDRSSVLGTSFCRVIDQAQTASFFYERLQHILRELTGTLDDMSPLQKQAAAITRYLMDKFEAILVILSKPPDSDSASHAKHWVELAHRDPKREKLKSILNEKLRALYAVQNIPNLPGGLQAQLQDEMIRTNSIRDACRADYDKPHIWAVFLACFEETGRPIYEYVALPAMKLAFTTEFTPPSKAHSRTEKLLPLCHRLLQRLESVPREESFLDGLEEHATVHLLHNLSLCMPAQKE